MVNSEGFLGQPGEGRGRGMGRVRRWVRVWREDSRISILVKSLSGGAGWHRLKSQVSL